jgi:D-threo-aldose 1-dehydrogenase
MTTTASLPTAELGNRGLALTRMGLGTGQLGAEEIAVEQGIATAQMAFAQGIRLFDTAPLYARGRSETRLGEALAGVPRDDYQISTKVGRILDEATGEISFDYSHDGVMRSLESSLARLRTDRVDLLLIHDPDHHIEEALTEAYPTVAELRRQGVVRAIGAGMNQWQALTHFAQEADFDCFLLAGRYTLLEQTALEFLELCRQKGIGLLLGGVYNSGILATGAVEGARYQYRTAPPEMMEKTGALQALCDRHGVALNSAALQFAQVPAAVTSLVVGAVAPEEVVANVAALQATIPAAFWTDLRTSGLIEADAPLPNGA